VSNQNPFGGRGRQLYPALPTGEVVMTYATYREAQVAVDLLARSDFPVDQLSIVGSDLKSVERVTGKLSWGRVAVAGAASGAWLGMFFGLLLVIFSSATSLGFVLAAILIGAGFGMLFGLASYALNRRRRDFTSVMQVIATSYSVIADHELGNRARNLLENTPDAGIAPVRHPSDPPFGGAPFTGSSFTAPGTDRPHSDVPAADRDGERPSSTLEPSGDGATGPGAHEPQPAAERPRYGENLPPEDSGDAGEGGSGTSAGQNS
jgi:hypothetical protein